MIKFPTFMVAFILIATLSLNAFAQDPSPSQIAEAEKAFNTEIVVKILEGKSHKEVQKSQKSAEPV